MLRIKLVKSLIGQVPSNVKHVKALGLRKISNVVLQNDTPEIRGMIHHAKHLLEVTVEEGTVPKRVPARIAAIRRKQGLTEAPAKKGPAPKAKAAPAEAKPAKVAKPKAAAPAKPKATAKKKAEGDK